MCLFVARGKYQGTCPGLPTWRKPTPISSDGSWAGVLTCCGGLWVPSKGLPLPGLPPSWGGVEGGLLQKQVPKALHKLAICLLQASVTKRPKRKLKGVQQKQYLVANTQIPSSPAFTSQQVKINLPFTGKNAANYNFICVFIGFKLLKLNHICFSQKQLITFEEICHIFGQTGMR